MGGPVGLDELVVDCVEAAVEAVLARHDLPWDEAAYLRIEHDVRTTAPGLAADALAVALDVLAAARRVRTRVNTLTSASLAGTVADAGAHLDRLVAPGFVTRSGTDRLPDVHRYVRGIEYRLDHLAGDIGRDLRRIDEVKAVEQEYAAVIARFAPVPAGLRDLAWSLEELRVSVFAQPVGVTGPVSATRIRRSMRSFE
jgi:ATP-dependent helicase HrpA